MNDIAQDPLVQSVAAALFAAALLHTFLARQFERLAARFPRHAGLFHLLGEVAIGAMGLLAGALLPTAIALAVFLL